MMTWEMLAIAAAFIWAATNVIDKYVLAKLVERPILPIIALGIVGLLASLLVLISQSVQALSFINVLLALLAGISYLGMTFGYFYAVQTEEISRVIPLFYFAPLFILIFAAFFLGEVLMPITYLGVLFLVIGAVCISWNGKLGFKFKKAFWLMILASIASAITQVTTKYLLGFADFWTIFAYERIGAFIPLIPILAMNGRYFKDLYRDKGFTPFALMSLSELLNNVALVLFILAASTGLITLVSAISSVQPFFVLLIAVFLSIFYRNILVEEMGKHTLLLKLLAIILMFVGALLVS